MVLDFRGLALTGLGLVFCATPFAADGFAGSALFVLGLEGIVFTTGCRRARTVRIGTVWTGDFREFSVLAFDGRMMAS
jgi:altronate dehydratase